MRHMLASFLCGAHYEGAQAHEYPGWPVPRTQFDAQIGQRTFDDFLEYAALADELGFDWVSLSEHHYSPLILTPSVATLAGALTQVVKRARLALLGPLATLNNPIRTAEEVAMLDHLSHGRLIVLPLRGTPNEFNSYRPLDAPTTKTMTQEATLLIQKALSEDEPFAWNGEHFQFPVVSVWPGPIQRPFPPMLFSGNSFDSAMFAAQHRLGLCFSFHAPDVVARTVEAYYTEAERVGWQPTPDQIVYRGYVVVADTEEEAKRLEPTLMPPRLVAAITANKQLQIQQGGNASLANGASAVYGVGRVLFVGTPDTVVGQVGAFQASTGVGVLDLIFSGGITPRDAVRRSIDLFGREVLPRIRELAPVA